MYIPDLPTYLVFYLETTCGSSIVTLMMTMMTTAMTTTMMTTHFKSLYIPDASNMKHQASSNLSKLYSTAYSI
jgi:hypothetical protein